MCGEAGSPFRVGHLGGVPLGGGLPAIPDGLPAAPHKAKHPVGRVTYRYLYGHGLVAGRGRVHVWCGREPMLGGAPGCGSHGRWGCEPYRLAYRQPH